MRLPSSLWSYLTIGLLVGVGAAAPLSAVTAIDLQKQLAEKEPVTVIDIRTPTLFARSHIPGAINVPASLCAAKNLPPLGKVVVCDGGLGHESIDAAAAALGAKPGITAEVLEGGLAAWETAQGQTTQAQGIHKEIQNYISYSEVKALKANDSVLVDLRSTTKPSVSAAASKAAASQPLTDLSQEFPGLPVSRSAFRAAAPKTSTGTLTPPLLVLIDNGDGVAQTTARTLQANGVRRYTILAGGELILSRHGQAGRQRSSPASQPASLAAPSSQATH